MEDYPFTILTVFILRASGIIVPMYIIIRTIGGVHSSIHRHYHQDSNDDDTSTISDEDDEENETSQDERFRIFIVIVDMVCFNCIGALC
ncbi:hypothetical protein Ahy_B10g101611 [Arachis hypogaea]|uniref:Uncharacterized protein n=1 Tax=Arachis hypogaea TaxID=3818 RepID=A0A444X009_ARAHY|nr:hypothetical protein Ahy_B10g101611 [Arachis hypogaea]